MKYMVKVLTILVILLIIISSFYEIYGATGLNPKTAMASMKNGQANTADTASIKPVLNTIIGAIQIAGTGISLVMVSILGIKYMLASPNDKADVKKQIMPMLIGAILLFGSVNIMQAISTFADKALK